MLELFYAVYTLIYQFSNWLVIDFIGNYILVSKERTFLILISFPAVIAFIIWAIKNPWLFKDRIIDFIPNRFRDIKHFFQRGIRGYADCDAWNFDNYIMKMISNVSVWLKKNKHGVSGYFLNERTDNSDDRLTEEEIKRQNDYYDKIKAACDFYLNHEDLEIEEVKKFIPDYYDRIWLSSGKLEWKHTEEEEIVVKEIRDRYRKMYDENKLVLREFIDKLECWWD